MDEYLCVTVLSQPGEGETAFKARLSAFWTGMLRNHPGQFASVYAETVAFEQIDDRYSRKYLVEVEIVEFLAAQMKVHGVELEPIDGDDVYSKYEASPPDWMWIEH